MARRITSGGVSLAYDPAGRLHQVAGGTTTRFLYDGADLIAEYNASGTVLKRYVHGPGLDEPLVWYEGAGTSDRRYLLADERGSVIGVVSNAGAVTVNKYDAYGTPAATNQGRFQYTGQLWLSEVGLYHYKARAYHPWLVRFLQTDPIGYAGGMNLYGYVGNDPINKHDPTGLVEEQDKQQFGCVHNTHCQPVPYICYASRINTAPGSGCGGSYYDPSYYDSYYDYLYALQERPRDVNDRFALLVAEGFFKIGPYTIADNTVDGQKIIDAGERWIGTVYKIGGDGICTVGIDCSHFVNNVYRDAGYPYDYSSTREFSSNSKFFQVSDPQVGDVVLFDSHMGLYNPYPPVAGRTVLSADSGGVRYGSPDWYSGTPIYFRYILE